LRPLKNPNFVIANEVKQSLSKTTKSVLSLVLRLLQDFVLRNDISADFALKKTFSYPDISIKIQRNPLSIGKSLILSFDLPDGRGWKN